MKKLLLIICLFMATNAMAQEKEPFLAGSGSHVGKIMLGISEKELKKLFPAEFRTTSYLRELTDFRSFDSTIPIDSMVQFVVGFDKMLTTSDDDLEIFPVWHFGFRNDSLVYMGVTSYRSASEKDNVLLDQKIRFYQDIPTVDAFMGSDYMTINYREYDTRIYFKQGVEFMFDEGKLRFFSLFKPDPGFLQRISEKREKLLADFKKVDADNDDEDQ